MILSLGLLVARHFVRVGWIEVEKVKLQIIAGQPRNVCEPGPSKEPSCSAAHSGVSPVIQVSWSRADLRKDFLMSYLENKDRSGGGMVDDLQFFADERKAYVRFAEEECKLVLLSCSH